MYKKKNKSRLKYLSLALFVVFLGAIILGAGLIRRWHRELEREAAALKVVPVEEKKITIIEGWNLTAIEKYLEKEGFDFKDSVLDLKAKDFAEDFPLLGEASRSASLEGYFFPDTYRVYASSTLADVTEKALGNFSKKITSEMVADIKKQGRTLPEILTMASIIEKEVKGERDMKIVSGIFWDRIKNGQGLESCATLAYILGENKTQYSEADTKIDSPYNTYRHRGLPPGPIANPGLVAIKAAIYPIYTDYNYFLNRLDNGETVFSRNYQEHLSNKAKYLK